MTQPLSQRQLTHVAHETTTSLTDQELAVIAIAASHPQVCSPVDAVNLIVQARTESRSAATLLQQKVGEAQLAKLIASELNFPFVDMDDPNTTLVTSTVVLTQVDVNALARAQAIPLVTPDDDIVVAFANPRAHQDTITYLRSVFPDGFTIALGLGNQIASRLLAAGASAVPTSGGQSASLEVGADPDAAVNLVEWVDTMLARAHAERASDVSIRFDLGAGDVPELVLRWRVDGQWWRQPVPVGIKGREREVVGTLLARCETTKAQDFRSPQDGAFAFEVIGGRQVDARLGMIPQVHGPGLTLRLLDPVSVQRNLEQMGFAARPLQIMRDAIASPQGMVFVIGPTGSGKSTTLYGMLYEIDTDTRNVLTAEDPVEYRMPGIGQTQIRSGLGEEKSLTFAKALRSFMRMAPDVILVGEVRDAETASTAVHASLTGHLMLSTIHANDAFGVFQRLEEMGVSSGNAADALLLAMSQRLVRKVHSCGSLRPPTVEEAAFLTRHELDIPDVVAAPRDNGCTGCHNTGFLGRTPVAEILQPSIAVRDAVTLHKPMSHVRAAAKETGGWLPILTDAHVHVVEGTIPVSELVRVSMVAGS